MMTQHDRVGQREAWGCEDAPTSHPPSWESREASQRRCLLWMDLN